MKFCIFISCYSLNIIIGFAQQVPFSRTEQLSKLMIAAQTLAHDSMQGRLVGTPGEAKAISFITNQFIAYGLEPKGTEGYLQPFSFTRLGIIQSDFELTIKHRRNEIYQKGISSSLYPASISGGGSCKSKAVYVGYGLYSPTKSTHDYTGKNVKGKIALIEWGYPASLNPHSEEIQQTTIQAKVDAAIANGAVGVVFFKSDTGGYLPTYKKYITKSETRSIPVCIMASPYGEWMHGATISLNVSIREQTIKGRNVVGYISNQATHTLIIGAHFDHLGYNEFGHSTWIPKAGEQPQIHNGADDNASGTAVLIQLAEVIKQYGSRNMNYLFIAFSGEEEGLLGSNYFVKHPTVSLNQTLAMINMDMVGRMDSIKNTIGILGTGTASEWSELLKGIQIDSLHYIYTLSGTGASDHTSFYNDSIPVLHYFTGTHYDYHKPTDDAEKVNYIGMYKVLTHIYLLTEKLNAAPKLSFQRTAEDTTVRVSFKVTLGIMPDYLYEERGVKLDGVTPGKPADIGGMKKGDIIIQLDTIPISSMQDYMHALSKYNKGDKVAITYIRNGKETVTTIQF